MFLFCFLDYTARAQSMLAKTAVLVHCRRLLHHSLDGRLPELAAIGPASLTAVAVWYLWKECCKLTLEKRR